MGRVNNNLDELEDDIKSLEISPDDMKALREEEQKHKVTKKPMHMHRPPKLLLRGVIIINVINISRIQTICYANYYDSPQRELGLPVVYRF